MPTAFTFVPSVQLLDFESLCPLIRHVSLIYGFCLLDQPEFPGCFYYHGSNSAEDLY